MSDTSSPKVCGCLCEPMGHSNHQCEGFAAAGMAVPLTDRPTDYLVPACRFCFEAVRRRLLKPQPGIRQGVRHRYSDRLPRDVRSAQQ